MTLSVMKRAKEMCKDNFNTESRRDFYVDRIKALEAENKKLKNTLFEIQDTLYGQGMQVTNWHLNGDLQDLDYFFDENNWILGK